MPYQGVVQITTDSGTKNVCWESLTHIEDSIVCRHLGYYYLTAHKISTPMNAKDATFSGSIKCVREDLGDRYLSQSSMTASGNDSCSGLRHIDCKCGEIKLEIKEGTNGMQMLKKREKNIRN